MNYTWYADVSGETPVEQGDIIEKCQIIIANEKHYRAMMGDGGDTPLDVKEINGIVLSQSCDIQNDKIDSLIICPVWSLEFFRVKGGYYESNNAREDLRRGKFPEYHLLQKVKLGRHAEDFYFVDFHHIYTVPKKIVESVIANKNRKRLLPPYREHLSQSFARYFMRVGLPVDIPKDEIKNYRS